MHPEHPLGRRLRRTSLDVVDRHLEVMAHFPPWDLRRVLGPDLARRLRGHDPFAAARDRHAHDAATLGAVPALLALDTATYMIDDVLVKVDRTSMMHSLEVRCPLLDHEVLELVATIPFHYKLRGDVSKWILRECVRDLLPPAILARGKQGFGMPLERWLGDDFGRLAREVLLDPRCAGRGWLDAREVGRVLESRERRPDAHARQVWTLLCLELWAQTYVDRAGDGVAAPLEPAWTSRSTAAA